MRNLFILLLSLSCAIISCNSQQEEKKSENTDSLRTSEYLMVWNDEFDYKGLPDSTKWSYDIEGNSNSWGNNELQNYTANRKENSFVDGEFLHITAIKETWENKDYTSARLITKEKGDWLYGRFEVRAKLPSGIGIWPAIWMLPSDSEYGIWPKSGEIDIMEHVGYIPDSIFASAHTESFHHSIGTNKTGSIKLTDCETEFHTYIVEWNEKEYKAFVDSTLYFSFKNDGTGYKNWPFDKRFHILLNVAVGGFWGAVEGIDNNIFPQEMIIDFVRVYQK